MAEAVEMSATILGALATAGVLGVTHAIEPDHVAGISSLTSRCGDSRLSALAGACFSVGHVVLVVAWLVVGYLLLGQTSFPDLFDAVGTLGVAVILGTLGAVMAVGGLRSVLHAHEHEHDGEAHAHPHLHLPRLGDEHGGSADSHHQHHYDHQHHHGHEHHHDHQHHHDHGVGRYLRTGLVGALFTLSPPLSMIAFSSTLFPEYGSGVVALAVATYAVAITASMSLIGVGVGTLFGATAVSPRAYGVSRVLGGVLVAGLAASMLVESLPTLG